MKPVKGEAYFLSNPSELPDPTRREWLAEVGACVLTLVTLRFNEVRFRGHASSPAAENCSFRCFWLGEVPHTAAWWNRARLLSRGERQL